VKAIYVLFFSFLVLFQGAGLCQKNNPRTDNSFKGIRRNYYSDNKKADRLGVFIDSLVKNYMSSPQNNGLSIAIVDTGAPRFFNYGEQSAGLTTSTASIYETGSITQVVLGILLSQAVDEKKIKPLEDIRHFLPDSCSGLHYHSKAVLVQDLAFHTSGLDRLPYNLYQQEPFDSLNPLKNYSDALFYSYLSQVKPVKMPGQGVTYSIMNSAILGLILEKVYGMPIKTLVNEKIIVPLDLGGTTFENVSGDHNASGHDRNGNAVPAWEFGSIPAAGGLRSSTSDLANLLKFMLGDNEKSKAGLKVYKVGNELANYSCFVKLNSQSEKFYWQNIGTGGFSVFYGFVKEAKMGVIILSNSSMNVDHLALPILKYYNLK